MMRLPLKCDLDERYRNNRKEMNSFSKEWYNNTALNTEYWI